jgi:hypothetical protein
LKALNRTFSRKLNKTKKTITKEKTKKKEAKFSTHYLSKNRNGNEESNNGLKQKKSSKPTT